jgi:hypothetical protein
MSLFDGQLLTVEEIRQRTTTAPAGSLTIRDTKGRTVRRRPYWMDVGKGPAETTCRDCQHLTRTGHNGKYFKCDRAPITHGPGTDIRMKDEACRLFEAAP